MNISLLNFQKSNLLTVILFFFLIYMYSCSGFRLDTSAIPQTPSSPYHETTNSTWGADAFPGYACVDDSISFQWQTDPAGECESIDDCYFLIVTDNLGLLTDDLDILGGTGYINRDTNGFHLNGKIADLPEASWSGANPIFTFNVTNNAFLPTEIGFEPRISEVQIVQNPPAEPFEQPFLIPSVCTSTNQWDLGEFALNTFGLEFTQETKGFGRCVRVVSICYIPPVDPGAQYPMQIDLTIETESGIETPVRLSRGGCIEGRNLKATTIYRVQQVPPPALRYVGVCNSSGTELEGSGETTEPPFIELQFTFG